MAQVNCPYEDCDFPISTENLEDGEVIKCPECGDFVEVTNDGTKLMQAGDPDFEDDEEEPEEEED